MADNLYTHGIFVCLKLFHFCGFYPLLLGSLPTGSTSLLLGCMLICKMSASSWPIKDLCTRQSGWAYQQSTCRLCAYSQEACMVTGYMYRAYMWTLCTCKRSSELTHLKGGLLLQSHSLLHKFTVCTFNYVKNAVITLIHGVWSVQVAEMYFLQKPLTAPNVLLWGGWLKCVGAAILLALVLQMNWSRQHEACKGICSLALINQWELHYRSYASNLLH